MENNDNRRLNRDDHAKIEKAAKAVKKGLGYATGLVVAVGALAQKVDWANVADTLENTATKAVDIVRKIK